MAAVIYTKRIVTETKGAGEMDYEDEMDAQVDDATPVNQEPPKRRLHTIDNIATTMYWIKSASTLEAKPYKEEPLYVIYGI